MTDRSELDAKIDALTPAGIRFVSNLVDSLGRPLRTNVGQSWLSVVPEWIDYFGLTISAHHGTTVQPLKETLFEIAFRNACESVGWSVSPPASNTQRFVDMTVDDGSGPRKLSLKSTAAKKISKTKIDISKLTEAAWIQDMRSSRDRRTKTLELFREYRSAVDSIVMLRAFRDGESLPTKYQLVEIPSAIFESLETAPKELFDKDGPTIDCAYGGEPVAARVSLDRSDAKITIKSILLSVCTVHAEWHLDEAAESSI